MEVWHAPGRSKPTFEEAKRKHYRPLKKGERFGPSWTNHWVRQGIPAAAHLVLSIKVCLWLLGPDTPFRAKRIAAGGARAAGVRSGVGATGARST